MILNGDTPTFNIPGVQLAVILACLPVYAEILIDAFRRKPQPPDPNPVPDSEERDEDAKR